MVHIDINFDTRNLLDHRNLWRRNIYRIVVTAFYTTCVVRYDQGSSEPITSLLKKTGNNATGLKLQG